MSSNFTISIGNHSTNLTGLYLQSEKLFDDAARYRDVLQAQAIRPTTATNYLKILESIVLTVIKMLPDGDVKRLQQQGLAALTEDNSRILLTLYSNERICGSHKRALRRAVVALFPNAVIQPNVVVIRDGSTNLAELRQCSGKIFDDVLRYADLLRRELGCNIPRKAASYLKYIEHIILKADEVLPRDDLEQLRERGLAVLIDNDGRLLSAFHGNKEFPEYHRTALRRAVVALFPEAFVKRKEVIFGRRTADLTDLFRASENIFNDAIRYAEILRVQSHKPATCVGYINSLQHFVRKSFEILSSTDLEKLRLQGLIALTDDNGRILLTACSDKRIHRRDKGVMRRAVAALFPDAVIETYLVTIGSCSANLETLYRHSKRLFDDCARYGEFLRSQSDKITPQTSVVYLKIIERLLLQAYDILPSPDVEQLRMCGLVALIDDDGRILSMLLSNKRILQHHTTTLKRAISALFPGVSVIRKSVIIGDIAVNLTALYQYSEKLFKDAKKYGETLLSQATKARTAAVNVKYIEHIMLKAAEILPTEDVEQLQKRGLVALTDNKGSILTTLCGKKEIPDYHRSSLRRAVAALFPDAVTKKAVSIGNCGVDLTVLYQLSEKLFADSARWGGILEAQSKTSPKVSAGYLKYVQHIMCKAFEILSSVEVDELRQRGLVALTDDNGRILSLLCANKEIHANHKGALRQAVAALFPDKSPKQKLITMGVGTTDLTALFRCSEKLFEDARRYRDFLEVRADKASSSPSRYLQYLKNIENVMVKAFDFLPAHDVDCLTLHGLIALTEQNGRILSDLYKDKRITQYQKGALRTAVVALFPGALINPSSIFIGEYSANLAALHKRSETLFNDVVRYAAFLQAESKKLSRKTSLNYLKSIEHVMLTAFEVLPSADVERLLEEGLVAFTKDDGRLLFTLCSDERVPSRRAWILLMAVNALFPNILKQRKLVHVGQYSADLTLLYDRSEKLFSDAQRYGELLEVESTVRPETATRYLKNIEHVVLAAEEVLPKPDMDLLLREGLIALCYDDGRLLSALYSTKLIHVTKRTCLRLAVAALFPELIPGKRELKLYRLSFPNDFANQPDYCDYSPVRELSIKLYEDHVSYFDDLMASKADIAVDNVTLVNRFRQFRSIVLLSRNHLGQDDILTLREHGMAAFAINNFRLQKVLFAFLQSAVKSGFLRNTSAISYRSTLKWFLNEFGICVIDVFPIYTSRTSVHLRRLNAKDYYSAEECRELAYHIEFLLNDSGFSLSHRSALMLGRILLKTGWNLAPTLGIQCEDIIRRPSLLNPEGILTVVLNKARAGYRSDAYTFLASGANRAAIRSAAMDLLQVRDEWTSELRGLLPDSNPFKPYVFLHQYAGEIQRVSPKVTGMLTGLLRDNGCQLTFDSKKIRKGGYNHLYRDLQKNIREYEQAAKHKFKTFESNYLRVDENQSRYTLSKAVHVMGKYFTGKEISSEIVIATDPEQLLQHTPSGECVSKGNDDEALRYGAEHKRILEERHQTVRFCADFLSCIWCKFFRLVADQEHVWKLLSYRDYVLSSMEMSVVDGDSVEDQQTYIDILKERVNKILEVADRVTPGVIKKGYELLQTRGMHPDWRFALADVSIHGEYDNENGSS